MRRTNSGACIRHSIVCRLLLVASILAWGPGTSKIAAAGGPILFDASFLPVGVAGAPSAIAVADVNGDGFPDLIGTTLLGDVLNVVLNTGNGTFGQEFDYVTLQQPADVAVADLNLDGKPDIGICNYASNTVSIYLGNGDGTFTVKSHFQQSGPKPLSLVFGLINGDSTPDYAVVSSTGDIVSVAFGNGDGTFGPRADYPTGTNPVSVALGDFNNDLHLDVVVVNQGAVSFSILLNNGDGTFGPRTDTLFGYGTDVTVADLDLDGKQDLVLGRDEDPGKISVFFGNGNGTFGPRTDYTVGRLGRWVTVADLDHDGKRDIVAVNHGSDSFTVLFGRGNRTFGSRRDWTTGRSPYDVAVADMNQDGWVDVITAPSDGFGISFNHEQGVFGGQSPLTVPGSCCVTGVDVSHDGRTDILVGGSSLSVFLRRADGSYGPRADYPGGGVAMDTGDFNNDGLLDVVTANGANNTVSVYLGNGDGSFMPRTIFGTTGETYSVAASDFNYDGKLDFVATNTNWNSVSVFLGNGSGVRFSRTDYPVGSGPTCVAVGDVNGDRIHDLVVGDSGYPKALSVLFGRGENGFAPKVDYPATASPQALALGDLNRDGKLDVAVANNAGITTHLGDGLGHFPSFTRYDLIRALEGIAIGDVNGDGFLDLVAGSYDPSASAVSVLLGDGAGTFGQLVSYGAGLYPCYVDLCDLNHDQALDILTANSTDNTVSILMNISGAATSSVFEPGTGDSQPPVLLLGQNFPNPFRQSMTLTYSLGEPALVRLSIYDLLGRLIVRREEGERPAGSHSLIWDGQSDVGEVVSPGVYFLRLEAAGQMKTNKAVIAR